MGRSLRSCFSIHKRPLPRAVERAQKGPRESLAAYSIPRATRVLTLLPSDPANETAAGARQGVVLPECQFPFLQYGSSHRAAGLSVKPGECPGLGLGTLFGSEGSSQLPGLSCQGFLHCSYKHGCNPASHLRPETVVPANEVLGWSWTNTITRTRSWQLGDAGLENLAAKTAKGTQQLRETPGALEETHNQDPVEWKKRDIECCGTWLSVKASVVLRPWEPSSLAWLLRRSSTELVRSARGRGQC